MKSKQLYQSPTGERIFAVVFDPGDEVVTGLSEFARMQKLEAASFTALGAMSSVTFGYYDFDQQKYLPIKVGEQVEVLSLIGNVSLNEDGSPQVHPHIVVGKRDGAAMGGHLMQGLVKPTLEVTLTEEPAYLRRRFNKQMGMPLIDLSAD